MVLSEWLVALAQKRKNGANFLLILRRAFGYGQDLL
jgi:hypothetical protein